MGIAAATAATVVLPVMNRVLYKLALVPMRNYPFFLPQVTTFGYVIVYFSILFIRYHAGIVTKEMLALPKLRFVLIGLLEALGVASGMAAAAMLCGPSIPVLSQSFLVWQLILSVLILGRKYRANQNFGCLLVTAGVVLAVASNDGFICMSGWCIHNQGIPLAELPAYVNHGAACFLNIGGNLNDCHGAPLLPLLFITVNITFIISVLNLVKMSTALVASPTSTLAVPLSIFVLSLPLPYIPEGTRLSTSFLVGAAILVLGLLIYNLPQKTADQVKTA